MFKNSEVKVFLMLVCVITCTDASDFYSLVNQRLTIPPATLRGQSVCQPVTIFGDDVLEANETFTITISLTNSNDRLLGPNTTLVTILNDDRTLIDVLSVYVSNIAKLKTLNVQQEVSCTSLLAIILGQNGCQYSQ